MSKDSGKDLWIDDVPQAGYKGEEEKKEQVQDKENDGKYLKPVSVIRQLMKEDRYYSGAHCDDEPSMPGRLSQYIAEEVLRRAELTKE
jgi:hypothetical protein